MSDSNETILKVPESELREVYGLLSDATTAASTGDPNRCASLASDAKEKVVEIHEEVDRA